MIWFGLLAVLALQDIPFSKTSPGRVYERPAVRPFEPPSDFGREKAQGDGDAPVYRSPLTAPVSVDAYRHSYEVSQGDAEVAYDQGVAQAEHDSDTRMGSLDGRWTLVDDEGLTLAHLVLFDPGEGWMIEGAWMQPGGPGVADILAPLTDVRRDPDGTVSASLGDLGPLILEPAADGGWASTLQRGGRAARLRLLRPG